jgi:membrane-bound serine protease (ClpP class)
MMRAMSVFAMFMVISGLAAASATATTARVVTLNADIDMVDARFVDEQIRQADGEPLLVVALNSDGGTLTAIRRIADDIRAASVPVIVWIGPDGATARSTALLIAAAADGLALAPAATIGGGDGVLRSGGDRLGAADREEIRARLASSAGSSPERGAAFDRFLRGAQQMSGREAFVSRIALVTAENPGQLVERLDGRQTLDGAQLRTDGVDVRTQRPSQTLQLMALVAHPTLIAALLILGAIALTYEIVGSGSLFPGIALSGAALVIAIVGLTVLPVAWPGLAVMASGLALLVVELRRPARGVFAGIGALLVVAGSSLAFGAGDPALEPSLFVTGPVAAIAAFSVVMTGRATSQAAAQPLAVGVATLIGRHGQVDVSQGGMSHMTIDGERWTVVGLDGPVVPGTRVRVIGVRTEDLTLEVRAHKE